MRNLIIVAFLMIVSGNTLLAQSSERLYKKVFDNQIKSSKFFAEQAGEVWFNGSNGLKVRTKFTGLQYEITALRGNKGADLLILDPPDPLIIQVTEYDINGDGRNEIVVAYIPEIGLSNFSVYSSSNFALIGEGKGGEHLTLTHKGIDCVFYHQGNTNHVETWIIKNGKLKSPSH